MTWCIAEGKQLQKLDQKSFKEIWKNKWGRNGIQRVLGFEVAVFHVSL